MKKVLLTALLLLVPGLSADSTPRRIVREFVVNTGVQDWWLNGGWSWSDGALTHWAGSGTSAAELRAMPPLTSGRSYAIKFNHSGSSKGTVTFSLGKSSSLGYDWRGTFPITLNVTDPDALLTLTPTNDYEGSISNIRIVELGDELIGPNTLAVTPESGSQEDSSKRARLTAAVPVLIGHSYRVYFGVAGTSKEIFEPKRGSVSFAGNSAPFSVTGNYSFDMLAVDESPLIIDIEGAWIDGLIDRLSVRELVSDSAPTPTETAAAASISSEAR